MLKKAITYKNYEGISVTETFYFNYNKMDLIRLKARTGRDIEAQAKFLAESGDEEATINFLEDMILTSYGVKSPDGKSFLKPKEIRQAFEYSEAYGELFVELLMQPGAMAEFANGLVDQADKVPNSDKAEIIANHANRARPLEEKTEVLEAAKQDLDQLAFEAWKAEKLEKGGNIQ